MQILVVLAHPNLGSFNHAIAATTIEELSRAGHSVIYHDLCREGFTPGLEGEEIPREAAIDATVDEYCREVAAVDGIIVVHPNWWGQPPAILKGWIDRVFRPDVAYRFEEDDDGEGVPVGLLNANAAIVFNTSNTPIEREQDAFGDPLELIWKKCIFDLCGVKNFHRRMFSVVVTSSAEQRETWLEEVRKVVKESFPAE
jgi:NAD(P)H dehydrogenase (quinone)